MGQTEVNIFVNSDVYNCTSCVNDSRTGYVVNWPEDNNLNGYDSYGGLTSVTTWDGVYFSVASGTSCYVGPSSDIAVDGSVYTQVKVNMRLDIGHQVVIPTTGQIHFQTSNEGTWSSDKKVDFAVFPDNAYHEYIVDMASHIKWSGDISKIRVYPFVDGAQGIKVHLKSVEMESRSTYGCASSLTGTVCNYAHLYEHPCPWVGSAGYSKSRQLENGITITEGVNDKIIVNIDGYGEQGVTLTPVVGATISSIARDIQDKLNLVGVGGYAFARCFVNEGSIVIESDWYDSDSSVVVTDHEDSPAGSTLGFFDSAGIKTAVEESGTESASRYERFPLQLNSSAVRRLKNSDNTITTNSAFRVDGKVYSPQGGLTTYRTIKKDTKLQFRNQTVIDYNNPITSNGIIEFVGYSGDAYVNTEFRVYRQKIDGSMSLVGYVDMSVVTDDQDKIFEKTVSIPVKKGDLLSLYSAALHTGDQFDRADYQYILVDYKFESGGGMWELQGSGNKGLPLFARGSRRANEACLVVNFDEVQSIESVYITADEENSAEEINLCTVRNGGLNGGPHVSGVTGEGDGGAPAQSMVNLDSLIDGEKQNINTISSFCYPGWLDLEVTDQDDYLYTNFEIVFDFAKGLDVYFPIHRIVMYFVDESNVKTFSWQVPIATNPSDTERIWGEGWSRYGKVYTDSGLMNSNDFYLYNNPSVVYADDYQISYAQLVYRYLRLELEEPFYARSLRYNVSLDGLNISRPERDDFAFFPPAPGPRIQEIEVYTSSVPAKNISENFYIESSQDDENFVVHYDVDILSTTLARYTVGRPSTSLKVHIDSDSILKVFDIRGILSEDQVTYSTNYHDGTVALNPPKDNPDIAVETVTITNSAPETSNFYIDVFKDGVSNERCLLWNTMADDDAVARSELGPGGIIRRRVYRNLRPYNYAYRCPGYYLARDFARGQPAYLSKDNRSTWNNIGSVLTDSSNTTFITNESALFHQYGLVYVALDLGTNYDIDDITLYDGGNDGFSDVILYSQLDTDDPSVIPLDSGDVDGWRNGAKSNARWVLFRAVATNVGGPGIKYLTYVDIDLTLSSKVNRKKSIWRSAQGNLTNGKAGLFQAFQEEGWVVNGQSKYFCVDLGWWHNVTNVITGPFGVAAQSIEDTDVLEPGTWPSIVDSSGAGVDVAYSKNPTADPSEVDWGAFGVAPDNPVRWVLVKTDTRVEEIIVHVDNNVQNDKPSFLNKVWFTTAVHEVYNEFAETASGLAAIAMDYPENSSEEEFIRIDQSFGIDPELAKRDALSFWLYVSDVSALDYEYGYFRLGKSLTQDNTPLDINLVEDDYNYYEWSLSLFSGVLEDGWNYLRVPLSDNFREGRLFFASDDIARAGYTIKRDRITNFTFAFRGTGSNSPVTLRLDDITFNRRYYSEGKFGFGMYIPGGEYAKFPLNDFDPTKGTVEFYLKSDWTKEISCNSCQDPRDHTILRVFSSESDTLFMLFMSGQGLKFYVTDGLNPGMVTDNTFSIIESDVPTHVAITWDFVGDYDTPTMGIYIDNVLSASLDYDILEPYGVVKPAFVQSALYTMMVGGLGWTGLMSYDSSSVDGAIENLKIFNYPISDFSYVQNNHTFPTAPKGSDLIVLSLDGTNFYGTEDYGNGLPLFKKGVLPGESFPVYVKSRNLSRTKPGEKNRRANIAVARTPA